ncbi:unnamed protein product [Rotaria sordida]|uniref:Uncharacterized protein n=1 Tax=Rotaria sordida TaxID=392033 RepID=A0A814ZJ18_9BILA|nr:unnamed protein product [Rotaria sordida]CAF1525632.1 unnamed protein product [Rotaria sordida]
MLAFINTTNNDNVQVKVKMKIIYVRGISSSLEVTSSQTTLNIISDDKCLLDIGEIGVKLRLIEKLIRSCKDLIKQSTFIDVCMEAFTKNSDHFADALIQAESDLKQSCTGILSTIELNRNRTTITQRKEDKMINRDPGYYERNHKFTEEQLRYFVSVGPFQHRLHKFPKNKVLEAAKTTYCLVKDQEVSYLSKRSQDEYVQLLDVTIERLIVNEINQSPFISIMIDSTPDLSYQLPSKIGEDISQLLLDTLHRKVEELYNFFTSSVKRYYCLRNILEQSTFGLTIKSLSDTRWTANYESLHCVVESFSEIIDCLESIELVESKQFDKETKTQAKNIKNKLMSYEKLADEWAQMKDRRVKINQT